MAPVRPAWQQVGDTQRSLAGEQQYLLLRPLKIAGFFMKIRIDNGERFKYSCITVNVSGNTRQSSPPLSDFL